MARTATGAIAMVTLGAVMLVSAQSDALVAHDTTVVLHVANRAAVPADVLSEAKRLVGLVYGRIGVHLVWTEGYAGLAAADGAVHLDVQLLPADVVHPDYLATDIDHVVLGAAYEPARLARVFCDRIAHKATQTSAKGSLLLGLVIAHEVGHLLLPAFSHSPDGVMRAHGLSRISTMPSFTEAQGRTIRERLVASGNQR